MKTIEQPAEGTDSTKILLVDVHAISRESSRLLLDTITGFEVVGESSEHQEALQLASRLKPDIVIVSMRVEGASGPETAKAILNKVPGVQVVFWTLFDDPEYVRAALDSGARAYVLKQDPAMEIQTAIEHVLRGDTYLSPSLKNIRD